MIPTSAMGSRTSVPTNNREENCSLATLCICKSYGTLRTQGHDSGSWAAALTAHAHKSSDFLLYLQRIGGAHAHPQNQSQEHTTDDSLRHLQINITEGDDKKNKR